ncbi:hypothetical protein ACIBI8_31495 [Streptomyces sp. NPDC050529]|uniref:hypothetical protein n=1 Tax=Streptomyces sp. NPDC050529 TaxID=3365624 RepID=UPI0037A2E47D
MSDPRDPATREEWNRQWKMSRPRERREMLRALKGRNSDSPNHADDPYRSQSVSILWCAALFALCGWFGLILSAITGDLKISLVIPVGLLTAAAVSAFYGRRQRKIGFTLLAVAVLLGAMAWPRLMG